jgi:hypothetical protein
VTGDRKSWGLLIKLANASKELEFLKVFFLKKEREQNMFLTNYTPPAVPSLEHQLQLQHDPFVAKAVLFLNKISA